MAEAGAGRPLRPCRRSISWECRTSWREMNVVGARLMVVVEGDASDGRWWVSESRDGSARGTWRVW